MKMDMPTECAMIELMTSILDYYVVEVSDERQAVNLTTMRQCIALNMAYGETANDFQMIGIFKDADQAVVFANRTEAVFLKRLVDIANAKRRQLRAVR